MSYNFEKIILKKQYFLTKSITPLSSNNIVNLNLKNLLLIQNSQNTYKKKLFLYNKKLATCVKINFSANNLFCTF